MLEVGVGTQSSLLHPWLDEKGWPDVDLNASDTRVLLTCKVRVDFTCDVHVLVLTQVIRNGCALFMEHRSIFTILLFFQVNIVGPCWEERIKRHEEDKREIHALTYIHRDTQVDDKKVLRIFSPQRWHLPVK